MDKMHTIHISRSEEVYHHEEPSWQDGNVRGYNIEVLRGLQWYTAVTTEKNWAKFVEEWIRKHHAKNAKSMIANFHKQPSNFFDDVSRKNAAILARMSLRGFPLNAAHMDYVQAFIEVCQTPPSRKKQVAKVEEAKKPVPSVHDKIRKQITTTLSDLDVYIDQLFDKAETDPQDMISKIMLCQYKAPHLRQIQTYLQRSITEWKTAYAKEDPDLTEAYQYIGVRKLKKIIDEVQFIHDALSQRQSQLKAQRIVKKKPADKKKIVSKLQYLPQDDTLGITSVSPVSIIGSTTLWVYDVEKRKLGYFVGEAPNSLLVKGTTIFGFKEASMKILRHPDAQLAEFTKLRKNQLKTWFSQLTTREKDLSGRINANMLLLRID